MSASTSREVGERLLARLQAERSALNTSLAARISDNPNPMDSAYRAGYQQFLERAEEIGLVQAMLDLLGPKPAFPLPRPLRRRDADQPPHPWTVEDLPAGTAWWRYGLRHGEWLRLVVGPSEAAAHGLVARTGLYRHTVAEVLERGNLHGTPTELLAGVVQLDGWLEGP